MVHLKLTRKGIKRLITTMALIAPIIYLFGTMFTYLNGAHGDIVLAEPVYTEEYVLADSYIDDGSSYEIRNVGSLESWLSTSPSFREDTPDLFFNGVEVSYIQAFYYGNQYFGVYGVNGSSYYLATLSATYSENYRPWIFSGDIKYIYYRFLRAGVTFDLYKAVSVPTEVVPENNSANTAFLFGQMFPHDNFLSTIGADAVSDNPHGFAPFGAMLKFVDENMLHLADTDIGLMGYGYFYYSAHVLLFVLMFDLTTFFIHFVNKLGDRFAGGMKDD